FSGSTMLNSRARVDAYGASAKSAGFTAVPTSNPLLAACSRRVCAKVMLVLAARSRIKIKERTRDFLISIVNRFYPQITQRGLGRNQVAFWLQRSQMFIETVCEHDLRSSGARCFRQWYASPFRSAGARRSFGFSCSINITSLRDRE